MRPRSVVPLLPLLLLACPNEETTDTKNTQVDFIAMDLPAGVTSGEPVIALRVTNTTLPTSEAHAALSNIFNNEIRLQDMIMRGGMPRDEFGELILPLGAGGAASAPGMHADMLAATSPEQVRALQERMEVDDADPEGFPAGQAVDACGNPMLASFVTPDVMQHAATGAPSDLEAWPQACAALGNACDTSFYGTIDVSFSEVRFDGMMDMVVSVKPIVSSTPALPALFGHWLAYFLADGNYPGFREIPLVANMWEMVFAVQNMWSTIGVYTDGKGAREVYGFPHAARPVSNNEMIVALIGQEEADCIANYEARFDGEQPFGCDARQPFVVDRNPSDGGGSFVVNTYMAGGTDPRHLDQIGQVFAHQARAALACPSVGPEEQWLREGPVEFFLCPEGDIPGCIARQDMEDFACFPTPLTEQYLLPINPQTPMPIGPIREPYIVQTDYTYPYPIARVQLNVNAGTVLYLKEPARLERIIDTATSVEIQLPDPVDNTHCEADLVKRYNLGLDWPAANYTIEVSVTEGDLWMNLTNETVWRN